jgi:hypothetical protein
MPHPFIIDQSAAVVNMAAALLYGIAPASDNG